MGPPAEVIEAGNFEHSCEGEMVVKLTLDKVKLEGEKRKTNVDADGDI